MRDHQAVILAVWQGRQKRDERFYTALNASGISADEFNRLEEEARRVTRGFSPHLVLTPMTVGRRR